MHAHTHTHTHTVMVSQPSKYKETARSCTDSNTLRMHNPKTEKAAHPVGCCESRK